MSFSPFEKHFVAQIMIQPSEPELQNVLDMVNISVKRNWKFGVKSVRGHADLLNWVVFESNLVLSSNWTRIFSIFR